MSTVAEITRENAVEIIKAYNAMPDVPVHILDHATYILSEWLNDGAPIGEQRYRSPAEALLKFAALINSAHTDALEVENAKLRDALAWQPIDSDPPRDGTVVDLWFDATGKYRVTDMVWLSSTPAYPNGCWCKDGDDWTNADSFHQSPSHWMRPPCPPSDNAALSTSEQGEG